MARVILPLVLLLASTSAAHAQYHTRFNDDTGWTFVTSEPAFNWGVDNDPSGHSHSAPKSLNIQHADGFLVSATATSPAIDVSGMVYPELSFWTQADVAENVCTYDIRGVRILQEGGPGSFWYCLSKRSPSGLPFEEYRLPLNAAWGVIRVQFTFDTVDMLTNLGDGWFVDDLSVTDVSCPSPKYYCETSGNSTNPIGSLIYAEGSTSVSANDLQLLATGATPGQSALFFFGSQQALVPLGDGTLCVGGAIRRLPVISTGSGTVTFDVDTSTAPGDQLIVGSTWSFQCWYRDPGGVQGSNLSDGVELLFCP